MSNLMQNLDSSIQVTMSSIEIVDFINNHRKALGSNTVLRHIDFMRKVPQVLGEGVCEKFRTPYTHSQNGQTYSIFTFPKREACLMAMSYSYEIQAAVFDRMTALEDALTKPVIPQTYAEALQLAANQARQLELAAPKVEYYDKIVERSTLLNASQVAQKIKISAVKLNKLLDIFDVYHKGVKRARLFQQWFIDKGFGEVKQTELGFSQPMFTTKGEAWVIEKLTNEGLV
ncbi:phage antirepressor KilAC domain-containing protein [Acinetobacter beijerinckii]|uniref:phage antirepressor KilAC domain-containing protein n=1 Tax=Acinetobacter beijerinckii TaxID=262668 RepID=UPI0024068CDF|nr:phage antirepressor KilAC domain-containing protein [Acinetobacter beijerinckii]